MLDFGRFWYEVYMCAGCAHSDDNCQRCRRPIPWSSDPLASLCPWCRRKESHA